MLFLVDILYLKVVDFKQTTQKNNVRNIFVIGFISLFIWFGLFDIIKLCQFPYLYIWNNATKKRTKIVMFVWYIYICRKFVVKQLKMTIFEEFRQHVKMSFTAFYGNKNTRKIPFWLSLLEIYFKLDYLYESSDENLETKIYSKC